MIGEVHIRHKLDDWYLGIDFDQKIILPIATEVDMKMRLVYD